MRTTEKIIIEAWERGDFRIDKPSEVCMMTKNIESDRRNWENNYSQSEYNAKCQELKAMTLLCEGKELSKSELKREIEEYKELYFARCKDNALIKAKLESLKKELKEAIFYTQPVTHRQYKLIDQVYKDIDSKLEEIFDKYSTG